MGWKDNMYTDDTNLPEKGPEWNGLDIDKDVKKHADFVRTKKWGLDVRESLARAIEWISGMTNKKNAENKAIADGASKTANTAANEVKQVHSEIAAAIGKLTQDAEVVLARNDSEGKTWGTLKEHLDYIEQSRMTPSDLLSYLSNTEIEATFRLDYEGKIYGSDVENVNTFHVGYEPTLLPATTPLWQGTQSWYDLIAKNDGKASVASTTVEGKMAMNKFVYKPIEFFEKVLGEDFFTKQGAKTLAEKVALLKKIIYANSTWEKGGIFAYARGSSPTNNNVYARRWWKDSDWEGTSYSKTGTTIQKIGTALSAASINYFIDKDGCAYLVVYADPSDGKTPSEVEVDYAYLDITIKLSLYDFVASKVDLDALTKKVDTHIADKNNPHNVTSNQVNVIAAYSKKNDDDPSTYPTGLSTLMVRGDEGWPSYGTITTSKSYSSNGGVLQFYSPYAELGWGGPYLKYRTGIYQKSWSEWHEIATVEDVEKKEDKVFRAISTRAKVFGKWGGDIRVRREGKMCIVNIYSPGDSSVTNGLKVMQVLDNWAMPEKDPIGVYVPYQTTMWGLSKKNAADVPVTVEIYEDGLIMIAGIGTTGSADELYFPDIISLTGTFIYPAREPNAADWALANGSQKW